MHSTMISSFLVAAVLTCVGAQTTTEPITGLQGNATAVLNNPPGVDYQATLPAKSFFNPSDPRGNVKGSVSATANPDGIGVNVKVTFSNLPTSGGPFLYHIHAAPVSADGNCTNTLGHLDPFIRGETPPCDSELPQTCQVGDLSGKYGKITSDPFTANYTDYFASTEQGLGSFFGNRSITLHYGNTTRLTCANFTLQPATKASNSSGTGGATGTASSKPLQYTGVGGASTIAIPMLFVFGSVALGLML